MPEVVILTSAVGLGIYIPSLLIRQQLRHQGIMVSVELIEDFYTEKYQNSHINHGLAHHSNFALAQLAHRMTKDIQHALDAKKIEQLLSVWIKKQCRYFIIWSGFWLPIIHYYRDLTAWDLQIDCCRIDADISASFKIYAELNDIGREIWLWHGASNRLVYEISVGCSIQPPLSFAERATRLMVHGGGWGIGTYQERAKELAQAGFALDFVVHDASEAGFLKSEDCAYQLKTGWRAWQRNESGDLQFPPMMLFDGAMWQPCPLYEAYHTLYAVLLRNLAIVSKPGGCTLIDSLASATPVILLEPYGYAEARNSEIWQRLGFGIGYEDWRATGFSMQILQKLQHNLLTYEYRGRDYSLSYLTEVLEIG